MLLDVMIFRFCSKFFPLLALSSFVCFAEEVPSNLNSDFLLQKVRHAATLEQKRDLIGKLRRGSLKVPFSIHLRGDNMQFQYRPEKDWLQFHLALKEKGQELYEGINGKLTKFPSTKYNHYIAGTDITFDDLSLRFLYWPNGTILKHDHNAFVKGRECYMVSIPNPGKTGDYAWVRVWIDKQNGAMLQIEGLNAQGQIMKRFLLNSFMKLDNGAWFFQQMRIERIDPKTGKILGISYIELDSPKK